MIKGLSACVLLSLLTFFLWKTPNQPQAGDVSMPAGKFNSLSYAPYQAWQTPMDKSFPTPAQIARDMKLIKGEADGIRTYSSIEGTLPETMARIEAGTDIVGLAKKAGLKVWLGIWLSSNPADNRKEMAAGIAEANAYPDTVTRVVVGNEVLLRRDLSVEDLIKDIDYVHARVKQPVAYADVTDFWAQFPQVAPHVNIVMIHFLPYWENKPLSVDGALAEIGATTETFKKMFPGKQISIGETGWPSRGRWRGPAAPSRVNEAVFLRRFVALADKEGVDYNLIEAFDQNWKYEDEGVAGANWGIWNANRVQKFPLNGPVVEHPAWPWYAGLGALGGCLLFASVGFRNMRLAVPAFALGSGFALACMGTLPLLYDRWLRLDALVNLPLQAVLAFAAIRRADAFLAARPPAATRNGAEILARLRRGRFWFDYGSLWFLFLVSAAVFEALLVFDGRYRDAPMSVFIVAVMASVLRLWTRDRPALGWEEVLSGTALAALALADLVIEGPQNLEFIMWNIAALVLAAPVLLGVWRRFKARRTAL
ncbi:glycosyl hydrolase family 17 protein [Acidocella sp.]